MVRNLLKNNDGRYYRKAANGSKSVERGKSNIIELLNNELFKIALWLVLTAVLTLMFPIESLYMPLEAPKLGSIATEDIVAPFDYYINKSTEEIEQERSGIVRNLPAYMVYNEEIAAGVKESFREFFEDIGGLRPKIKNPKDMESFLAIYSGLDSSHVTVLANERIMGRYRDLILEVVDSLYGYGINDNMSNVPLAENRLVVIVKNNQRITVPRSQVHDLASAIKYTESTISKNTANEKLIEALLALFEFLIKPNLKFNLELTENARRKAMDNISPYKGMVLKGETIIRKHERVTQAHLEKLNSLAALRGGGSDDESMSVGWLPLIARFIFIGFLMAFIGAFLKYFKREIYNSPRRMILIFIIPILVAILIYFIDFQWQLSPYLIPVTLAAMLLAVLFEVEVGLLMAVVISLLVGIIRNFDFSLAFVSIVAGTVSAYSVRNVRHRHDFYRPIIYIVITYIITIYCIESLKFTETKDILKACAFGAFNGLISPLLVIALLPLFETTFKITTDITLLELSDLNHPLLKRLSLEAPGTYHHSIIMGTLAEEASKAIGANSLLARVGAYYHDIGKSLKAEYFVENQMGAKNKHEKLTPSMSALILESHVKEGREMAKLAGLPKIIIDFIEQHHGDSVMSFFYQKAIEKGASSDEASALRYPGPKPQFKESGIVAIADSVEAASRTLDDPKPSRIRNLVRKLIYDKFTSGQLDDSDLTIADIHKIEDAFVFVLTAIFHNRIEYPDKERVAS